MTRTPYPRQATSRMCFVCGRENPCGLHLHFYEDPAQGLVWSELVLADMYQGYPGIAHGGILATILDEVAGRALSVGQPEEVFWVTARLEVEYRQPTPLGVTLKAVGWVLERRSRSARCAAEIRLPDGTVTARAEALIVRPRPEVAQTWEVARQVWRVETATNED